MGRHLFKLTKFKLLLGRLWIWRRSFIELFNDFRVFGGDKAALDLQCGS